MISLELVPRDVESLLAEAQECMGIWGVDRINVPDIRRISLRSHDAAAHLLASGINAIPHIRTRDRSLAQQMQVIEPLVQAGLKEILLVSGDVVVGEDHSGCTPLELLAELKTQFPELLVYGALDPYRQDMRAELDYALAKLDAGMDALLSQPFFDDTLLQYWGRFFSPGQLWAGVAPVNSEKSQAYWEKINKVPFSKPLDYSLDGSAKLGAELVALATDMGHRAYLMPIRMKAVDYLRALENIQA